MQEGFREQGATTSYELTDGLPMYYHTKDSIPAAAFWLSSSVEVVRVAALGWLKLRFPFVRDRISG